MVQIDLCRYWLEVIGLLIIKKNLDVTYKSCMWQVYTKRKLTLCVSKDKTCFKSYYTSETDKEVTNIIYIFLLLILI